MLMKDFAAWSTNQPFGKMQKIMSDMNEQIMRENYELWSGITGTMMENAKNQSMLDRPDKMIRNNLDLMNQMTIQSIEYIQNYLEAWKNGIRECADCLQNETQNTFDEQDSSTRSKKAS